MTGKQILAIERKFKTYREDPVAFCHDMFPKEEQPRRDQAEVLAAIWKNKQTLIAAHRDWGKTRVAAYASWSWFVPRPNTLVTTLAPVWPQVTKLWLDIRHLWVVSKLPRIFPSWEVLTHEAHAHPLLPKWQMTAAAASEVQNIEGGHSAKNIPAFVIGDECKAIGNPFRDSLEGMLKNPESRFFGIGTPGIPYGWFYEGFTSKRRDYWQRQFRGDESSDPDVRAHVEKLGKSKGWDDPFFQQQWLAEFTGADEGVIIPLSIVRPAIGKKIVYDPKWRRVWAIDPAGKGEDETVITKRWGPVTLGFSSWQGWDIRKSEARIMEEIRAAVALNQGPSMIVIDEVGLGEGVVSHIRHYLKDTTIQVLAYRAGSPARDSVRFENIKAEQVYMLRELLKANAEAVDAGREPLISIPDHPLLIGQLCSLVADVSKKGRTIVVDPEDSPDYADSFVMSYAAERLGVGVRGVTPEGL